MNLFYHMCESSLLDVLEFIRIECNVPSKVKFNCSMNLHIVVACVTKFEQIFDEKSSLISFAFNIFSFLISHGSLSSYSAK